MINDIFLSFIYFFQSYLRCSIGFNGNIYFINSLINQNNNWSGILVLIYIFQGTLYLIFPHWYSSLYLITEWFIFTNIISEVIKFFNYIFNIWFLVFIRSSNNKSTTFWYHNVCSNIYYVNNPFWTRHQNYFTPFV